MNGLFITGTDTGIGKTYVTAAITRALRLARIPALPLKPVLCGERDDAIELQQACDNALSLDQINPLWLRQPLAPYTIGFLENRVIDPAPMLKSIEETMRNYSGPFLIEGAGGWLVPITRTFRVSDLALHLGLPILIVASAALGTINHTLLTLESIHHAGGRPLGILLNFHGIEPDQATNTNPAILADLTGLPVHSLSSGDPLDPLPPWLLEPCPF